jgi:hypothetical protein
VKISIIAWRTLGSIWASIHASVSAHGCVMTQDGTGVPFHANSSNP